ncbi:Hypothetical predicted protein [Mytilus galloprovincialis]|uniref:Uncharacterized protein n=1 Tax=Mytilus galloprovincialis TaxID=29158 RepID=A0A8B6BZP7_MYTGA|nr:Hypothetical predicted protein [Mytilus galloprovincialis]
MIYKNDIKSGNNTISLCWYIALVGAVIAAIVIPFYLIDACRTVDPKKSDREKIIAIPAMPSSTRFSTNEETDTHNQDYSTFNPKSSSRPALMNTLRRQPPKSTKELTTKYIKSFSIPPSKTKLLFNKTEIENPPSPAPYQMSPNSSKANAQSSSLVRNNSNVPEQHSISHNTKTINKNGKTMLKKSQSDSIKRPPVLMSITDIEESGEDMDDVVQVVTKSGGKSHFTESEWDKKKPKIPYSQSFSAKSVIKHFTWKKECLKFSGNVDNTQC